MQIFEGALPEASDASKAGVLGSNRIWLEEIGSTNEVLKVLAGQGCPHGTLVVAQRQTAGKGRRGRNWESQNEEGIWMSLLLRPNGLCSIPQLTQVFALGVVEGIFKATGIRCGIKWPNDIVLNHRKVCGILCEGHFQGDFCEYVVVGIGVNVNQEFFPETLNNLAISLKMQGGIVYDKLEIINHILESSDNFYTAFQQSGSFPVRQLQALSVNIGNELKVIKETRIVIGRAREITQDGNLLVEYEDGSLEALSSGEVSVRGIYDYI